MGDRSSTIGSTVVGALLATDWFMIIIIPLTSLSYMKLWWLISHRENNGPESLYFSGCCCGFILMNDKYLDSLRIQSRLIRHLKPEGSFTNCFKNPLGLISTPSSAFLLV